MLLPLGLSLYLDDGAHSAYDEALRDYEAALAVHALGPKKVFGLLLPDASGFVAAMDGANARVLVPEKGVAFTP